MDSREESPCPPSLETPTPSSEGASVEDLVMSEVHLGCPPNFSGAYVSCFTFSLPPVKDEPTLTHQVVSLDKDGDLVITRRSRRSNGNYVVNIQHSISSSIPSVGLQVWRAELILADFLLHKMETSSEFKGIVALELGAGTGLVGILLARVAKTVFLTDHGDEVLANCVDNVHLNSELFHSQASVHVRELDWKACWPPKVVKDSVSQRRYAWTSAEVEELQRASLIVAADVIYSDDLTDAFFNILEKIMKQSPEKVVYLALEKRYNFTLDGLNVVANGYSRFRSYLRDDAGEFDDQRSSPLPCFVGKCIDLTQIPQYLREYKRGNDVELWQIMTS